MQCDQKLGIRPCELTLVGILRCGFRIPSGWPANPKLDRSVIRSAFMRTQLISCRLPKADSALLRSSLFHHLCVRLLFVRWISFGEGVPLPRPGIQVVHGTVPQKCARNTLPARSGVLYRPAIEGLRCHPLPTSSTRAPEVTPN